MLGRYLVLVAGLLGGVSSAQSQAFRLPDAPNDEAIFGEGAREQIVSLAQDERGIVAAVGATSRGTNGGTDIYLLLVNPHDLSPWRERYIGRDGEDAAHRVRHRPEGGFLVAGYSERPSSRSPRRQLYAGKRDAWLLWLDEAGDTQAELVMGGDDDDEWVDLWPLRDGGWMLAGNKGPNAWVARLSATSELLWEKSWQSKGSPSQIKAAVLSWDDRFYITGSVATPQGKQWWAAQLALDGSIRWEKHYSPEQGTSANSICLYNHHTLAMAGEVAGPGLRPDGFVALMDAAGVVLQHQRLGGREADVAHQLARRADGGLLVLGESQSFQRGARRSQAWLVALDSVGAFQQERYYGSGYTDVGQALVRLHDGRWLCAGHASQPVLQSEQAWMWTLGRLEKSLPVADLPNLQLEWGELVHTHPPAKADLARDYLPLVLKNKRTDYASAAFSVDIQVPAHGYELIRSHQLPGLFALSGWVGIPMPGTGSIAEVALQPNCNNQKVGQSRLVSLASAQSAPIADAQPPTATPVAASQGPPATASSETASTTLAWISPNPDVFSAAELVWKSPTIPLQLKIISNQPIQAADLCFQVNGEPCHSGAKMDEVSLLGQGRTRTVNYQAQLKAGLNEIVATVTNQAGKASSTPLRIIYAPTKPNLHVLSIGVPSYDLKFTTHDARDFALSLATHAQQNMAFEHIFIDTLTHTQSTTKTAMLKSLRRLQYRYEDQQIGEEDLLIVFISSHGITGSEGEFRIAASDYDGPFVHETSLDFGSEIVSYLAAIPCQKVFLIDACHSGAIDSPKDVNARLVEWVAGARFDANLLLSCQADQYSYEDQAWQNGAFTEALVGAIELFFQQPTSLDTDGNRQLDMRELFGFVQQQTETLVAQKRPKPRTGQTPLLKLSTQPHLPILVSLPKN